MNNCHDCKKQKHVHEITGSNVCLQLERVIQDDIRGSGRIAHLQLHFGEKVAVRDRLRLDFDVYGILLVPSVVSVHDPFVAVSLFALVIAVIVSDGQGDLVAFG